MMSEEARRHLGRRLELKPGGTVNRFKCRYVPVGPNAAELIDLCQEHRTESPYSFEFGPHRPCMHASLEDKLPLTVTQFLGDRAHDVQKAAENSVLEEDHSKLAQTIHLVLNWHDSWPVLVESQPEFEDVQYGGEAIDRVVVRMTQKFEWVTTQEYKRKFGVDSPVAPLIRQMAMMWDTHPEFQDEWRIG